MGGRSVGHDAIVISKVLHGHVTDDAAASTVKLE